MTDAQSTIDALAKAVGTAEAGRRAGWARAYSAEASKDELSRDINILRVERDIMRSAASFTVGFIRKYLDLIGDQEAAKAFSRWSKNEAARILDDEVIRAGREAAAAVASDTLQRRSEQRAKRRDERDQVRKEANRENKRAERYYRNHERDYLCKKYGIPNQAALLNYLEQYRG